MKELLLGLLLVCAANAVSAHAQTTSDLQIELGAYGSTTNGGERPVGVWFSTGPIAIGRTSSSTFSATGSCEGFSVSSARDVREDATTAWPIEIVPIRVNRDAVTFRLRWARFSGLREQRQRSLDNIDSARTPHEDVELTLRVGESSVVDSIRVSDGAKTIDGKTCRGNASIRVLVDAYPSEEVDPRLVSADLWLIERLPDGREAQRSATQSIRGLPNRPISFFFDSISGAAAVLDMYGTVIVHPQDAGMSVSIETRSKWGRNGPSRSLESSTVLNPNEVVEVRLPKLGKLGGPFADREFSIRIRAAELR